MALNEVFLPAPRPFSQQVVVIITDGRSDDPVASTIQARPTGYEKLNSFLISEVEKRKLKFY